MNEHISSRVMEELEAHKHQVGGDAPHVPVGWAPQNNPFAKIVNGSWWYNHIQNNNFSKIVIFLASLFDHLEISGFKDNKKFSSNNKRRKAPEKNVTFSKNFFSSQLWISCDQLNIRLAKCQWKVRTSRIVVCSSNLEKIFQEKNLRISMKKI